ncbi:anti-sigma factor [Echinicola strongylocentroti]|uniref:Anti-sigma factor n=1 Tax=Echinicola strongylocentroti TaxID=1795355 RepID=A0A2Z4INL8_9BACT|nr:FecR domain-containing protein [Echinicola strongylocentroti]AWW32711.1 anti-sigma factor [Echinicola strongylocentroti]
MEEKITKLIIGTISDTELRELQEWMQDPDNRAMVQERLAEAQDVNLAFLDDDVDQAFRDTMKQIRQTEQPGKRKGLHWFKYGVAAVLIVGLSFLLQQFYFENDHPIPLPEGAITLDLGDGRIQVLQPGESKVVKDNQDEMIVRLEEEGLDYSGAYSGEELVYNTLNVPNGKTIQVILSDGSKVNLNAGSSLRYPVNFSASESREVFLTGEAYFSVAKNKEKAFLVHTQGVEVKVYGTAFNVSSYKENEDVEVVLIEGAVGLQKEGGKQEDEVRLIPGQRGAYNSTDKNIQVDEVNTGIYTAWLKGELIFRDQTFNQILKKLERNYNIDIQNNNEELGREKFNASFGKVGIEEVLEYFNETHAINYSIDNNKVIIN